MKWTSEKMIQSLWSRRLRNHAASWRPQIVHFGILKRWAQAQGSVSSKPREYLTRRVLLFLLAVIPAWGQCPAQSTHKVPFVLKDNVIWVQARVNGYPAILKIDTGATTSVFAARFQTVHNAKEIEVRTAGGMVKGTHADGHCEIGDLKFEFSVVYLRDFIDEGVIGIDVLQQFAKVIIDMRTREIELVPFANFDGQDFGPERVSR